MKFFTNFFNSIKNRSSVNFSHNLFFIRQMLSTTISHTNKAHIFLPLKTLKIKFFKSNFVNLWLQFIILFNFILFIAALVIYI